jgi:prevent-host-death family protein
MQINSRELRDNLSDYLRLAREGQNIEVTKHGEVIARLLPPESKVLDVEALKAFHVSLGVKKVPNAVLVAREEAER